jgi:uncharacterized protein YcfJ
MSVHLRLLVQGGQHETHYLLVLFSIFSLPVFAASASFTMDGQVVRVEPRVRHSTTYERECWTEAVPVQSSQNRSYGGAVLGGVTGGVVGNQIGKGHGKDVATAVGAAIGAIVGDNIDNDGYRSAPRSSIAPKSVAVPFRSPGRFRTDTT